MKLLTQIPFHKQENNLLIDYNSSILLLGSCFAEDIGEKLEYYKLKNLSNPLGILFHPLAYLLDFLVLLELGILNL